MKGTTKILANLRSLMQNKNLAAYIVPTEDAHQSEYISEHDERRAYISGFDGSAGTAVVTLDKALLWTDGRYYKQAEQQLDANWLLMKSGLPDTPTMGGWLCKNLPANGVIGFDPKLISYRVWKPLRKELEPSNFKLQPITENLVDLIWQADGENTQPVQSMSAIFAQDLQFAGATVAAKCARLREQMHEVGTQAIVVSALDEIAWLLNLRGNDITYNPVFMAYLIVTPKEIMLFVHEQKLQNLTKTHWLENGVEVLIRPYADIGKELAGFVESTTWNFLISPMSSYYLNSLIPKQRRLQTITPITLNKAIKNDVEVRGFISCHIRDGVALCKYFAWLEDALNSGANVCECSGSLKLSEFRSQLEHYKGDSFATISASGPNGAIIHYEPKAETSRRITKDELYLCDSGAQFNDGTTDVTRTFHFGEPTVDQKEAYTRVLKGQLTLGSTIFPVKTKGHILDIIARKALWDIGLDYSHGTGHGVGHYLNVHEGPMGISFRLIPDDPGLQENMFISNEPGYYENNEYGIRIEDIVQIVPAKSKHNFASRGALTFKTITMCPKQTKLINKDLMSTTELQLLNDYHRVVWETLSPILEREHDQLTLSWLRRETQPI